MQASPPWTAPTGTLGRILAETKERVDALKRRQSELRRVAASVPTPPAFQLALTREAVAVIAEVKRRSPSKGAINSSITASEQAKAYEAGGAAAISVLTEPNHFDGSPDDLTDVRAAVFVPALKKDFHIDPIQLVEAKALGASAALLIARALAPAHLREMVDAARQLSLEVLVEIRDEAELACAVDAGASIIGINNRNLETLVIDPATSERLLPLIPPSAIAVAESGISTRADVARVARVGADAILVGSAISAAADPRAAVAMLADIPRVPRVG